MIYLLNYLFFIFLGNTWEVELKIEWAKPSLILSANNFLFWVLILSFCFPFWFRVFEIMGFSSFRKEERRLLKKLKIAFWCFWKCYASWFFSRNVIPNTISYLFSFLLISLANLPYVAGPCMCKLLNIVFHIIVKLEVTSSLFNWTIA